MRWTQGARLTGDAACGRRSRVVLTPRCWRQVPRETSFPGATAARKPVAGEIAKEAVKTIARGMPGVFRCDLTTRVRNSTISAHAAIGRIGRPAFPAPSERRARKFSSTARAKCAARSRSRVGVIGRLARDPQLSSPGSTGRPGIPETVVHEPRSRGVPDTCMRGYDDQLRGENAHKPPLSVAPAFAGRR